ncbi:hypothetical protein [Polluticoccus soli]|uniref:hypothetical protein n=1 Tax=Polluticoccus soli TaxID=3034150 RepID=UPI0023E0C006|nr:hypothetical protein [Flavipsychrobacter sp. JY13-12]
MRLVSTFLLTVCILTAKGQKYLSILPYNMSDLGWYCGITYGGKISPLYTVNGGVTVHFNNRKVPDRNPDLYLHQRFYGRELHQYIGLTGNIQRDLQIFKSENVNTYAFYELTARTSGASSFKRTHVEYVFDTLNNGLYEIVRRDYTELNNLWAFDNIVGVGLRARMFRGVYFTSNFGIGTNLIFNVPSFISTSGLVAEYSLKYNAGMTVKFK